MSEDTKRRPIKERATGWARMLASGAAKLGLTPNQISILSVAISAVGFASFFDHQHRPLYFLVGGLCITARLICNMIDGMVAVEYNRRSPSGEIYNELPDRISDTFSLMGAAYACGWIQLGLWSSLAAILTAYIRTLSTSAGAPADFGGPMAKQQRMKALIAASVFSALAPQWSDRFFLGALLLILVGSLATSARRVTRAIGYLEGQANERT